VDRLRDQGREPGFSTFELSEGICTGLQHLQAGSKSQWWINTPGARIEVHFGGVKMEVFPKHGDDKPIVAS
jgi:hypothetical protein